MQLSLFQNAHTIVCDPPPRREPIHYVPVYKVQLVHDGATSTPRPQLRSSQDSAKLFRQFLQGSIENTSWWPSWPAKTW
jgi:hypothetical protein